MALIKTDSQNYTDIANAIRNLVSEVLFDSDVITEYDEMGAPFYEYSTTIGSTMVDGDKFTIVYDGIGYLYDGYYAGVANEVGNYSLWTIPYITYMAENEGMTFDEYLDANPMWKELIVDTGEPFFVTITDEFISFVTKETGTYHFTIYKGEYKQYKPEEMADAIGEYIPDCGISYDQVDSDGNVLEVTTYGSKVTCMGVCTDNTIINFSDIATEIGDYAFYQNERITSLVIPNGITKIGDSAFEFSSISTVVFPETLTEIKEFAFEHCDLSISEVPRSVSIIGDYAFSGCDNISNLCFYENIDYIGYGAFSYCDNLTEVTFKGTPSTMGKDIFYNCTNLTTINVPWLEGEVLNAPWGAENATINYGCIIE